MKELQKSYHPQSELKELKQQHESLRQQVGVLSVSTKDSSKLTKEINFLKEKIEKIHAKDNEMVAVLLKEQQQITEDIKNSEFDNKHLSKDLNDSTFKLNAYIKAFPDHE